MATVVRIPLSSAPGGSLICVIKAATPGTPIHSAIGGASQYDLVTLFACNNSSANMVVTLEVGGVADVNLKKITIPGHAGDVTLLDRKYMGSSINIAGICANSSIITIDGWVDRVTL